MLPSFTAALKGPWGKVTRIIMRMWFSSRHSEFWRTSMGPEIGEAAKLRHSNVTRQIDLAISRENHPA
jgi:hypothetical protein